MLEKVRKELENNGFNYEAMAERKTHDRRSDALRTLEFVAETQKIIENEPSKLMSAIVREKDIDEKSIRLVVHEDISYFSFKLRKEQFLFKVMQENDWSTQRSSNKLKHPLEPVMLRFFSDKKNYAKPDQLLEEQMAHCLT